MAIGIKTTKCQSWTAGRSRLLRRINLLQHFAYWITELLHGLFRSWFWGMHVQNCINKQNLSTFPVCLIYDRLQSTGSFFHDKSITLGSLMDDSSSSIVELSRRSPRGITEGSLGGEGDRKNICLKSKAWLFSLCCKLSTDAVSATRTRSLAHFLEAERRKSAAAANCRRNQLRISAMPNNLVTSSWTNTVFSCKMVGLNRNQGEWLNDGNGNGVLGVVFMLVLLLPLMLSGSSSSVSTVAALYLSIFG